MKVLSKSAHYQSDIQGLRAIAVLLVIFYHSGLPGLPGGYIGVDVFFVISGYLITGLLLRELNRSGSVSLTQFYARRLRRLLPAASFVLLATIAVAWFVYSPLALKQFLSSAFATSIYLSNVWFAHLSTDYLAEDTASNPLLHTWSLGVEEQFYLIWPLLLLLTFRLGRPERIHRRLVIVLIGVTLASFLSAYWLTTYNQPWAFFGSPTRAWEFAAGGLVAIIFSRGFSPNPRTAIAMGWVGLVIVMLSAAIFDRTTPFPGVAAIAPVIGSVLLIASAHNSGERGVSVLLSNRHMQVIGDMSYSLYLWHWPVFVFLANHSADLNPQRVFLNILLVFLLSWFTLVLVENPVRFDKRLSQKAIGSLLVGATLTFLTAGVALGVRHVAANSLSTPTQQLIAEAKKDIPRIYADGCHLDPLETEVPDCIYGDTEADQIVILFGDSHAAHWFPALEKLAIEKSWKLVSMTKSGCPSAAHEPFSEMLGRPYTECTAWRGNALDRINTLRPRLTVISNIHSYTTNAPRGLAEWQGNIREVLDSIALSSDQVLVISDTPQANRPVPDCLSHAEWMNQDPKDQCQVAALDDLAIGVRTAEDAAAAHFRNVLVVDPLSSICIGFPCPVQIDKTIKFSDKDHLTATYSRSLRNLLTQFF